MGRPWLVEARLDCDGEAERDGGCGVWVGGSGLTSFGAHRRATRAARNGRWVLVMDPDGKPWWFCPAHVRSVDPAPAAGLVR